MGIAVVTDITTFCCHIGVCRATEAEQMLQLISKFGDKILNESTMYDLKQQIKEQLPKSTKTVNLNDLVEKKVKIYTEHYCKK